MNERVAELLEAGPAALNDADYALLERIGTELVSVCGDDERARARGFTFIGNAKLQTGDGDAAEAHYFKALDIYRKLGDEGFEAQVLMNLGVVAVEINLDVAEARRLFDLALPMMRRTGDKARLALGLGNLGELARLESDFPAALIQATESLELYEALGEAERAAWQRTNIAHVRSLMRDYAGAIDSLRAAYATLEEKKNPHWLSIYFDVWFLLAMELRAYEPAARLAGFNDRYRMQNTVPRLSGLMPWFVPSMDRLRKRLDESRFAELRSEGAHFSLSEAQAQTALIHLKD